MSQVPPEHDITIALNGVFLVEVAHQEQVTYGNFDITRYKHEDCHKWSKFHDPISFGELQKKVAGATTYRPFNYEDQRRNAVSSISNDCDS